MGGTLGVWMIGAFGDVATCVAAGCEALHRGLARPVGLVTETPPFADLPLTPFGRVGFGGHEVRRSSMLESARKLQQGAGLFGGDLLERVSAALEHASRRVRPGLLAGSGQAVQSLAADGFTIDQIGAAAVRHLQQDLTAFQEWGGYDQVVVVHLASTEPPPKCPTNLPETAAALWALLESDPHALPPSSLYALAAIDLGLPYLNFTPSLGASIPGIRQLAEERGVPHMGRDGKTGQTLLRTTLAPMFAARGLDVLSWAGFNILGNRDGEVLQCPEAQASKLATKEGPLNAILDGHLGQALTRIDYVRSLGDRKTAWDHIHFEGFLGSTGTLQLTWSASDSALAAPLVLDLCRLLALAQRRGLHGLITPLAAFFKEPEGVSEHSFMAQQQMLVEFAEQLRASAPTPPTT